MPRNSSGIYSLPQAPFVPGTVISSSAVNSDFSDIATALTGSIAANGSTPITGQLKTSVSASPAFTSSTDTTTGIGFQTAGEVDLYASGSVIVSVTGAGATVNGNQTVTGNLTVTGTVTAGSFNFGGTGAIQIPSGTTAQRPASPVTGQIRYNSTNGNYEGYDGIEWDPMSQVNSRFTLTASVQFNLLTVSLLNALTAAAPTPADPVAITFRDATLPNGDPVTVVVNSALSINTNGVGATLGSSSNVPFRFWVVAFNNGGTIVLALKNCSVAGQIFSLNEAALQSSTPMSGAATSAGVFYTPNGVTVTNQPFKILGYLEYSAGLGTAGTYGILPTTIELFGNGIKKPGDIIQTAYFQTATATSLSGSFSATAITNSIMPTSTINPILINAVGQAAAGISGTSASQVQAVLRRGTATNISQAQDVGINNSAGVVSAPCVFDVLDNPGVVSSQPYTVYANNNVGSGTFGTGSIRLTELMG
jgi:hypothetical protein